MNAPRMTAALGHLLRQSCRTLHADIAARCNSCYGPSAMRIRRVVVVSSSRTDEWLRWQRCRCLSVLSGPASV